MDLFFSWKPFKINLIKLSEYLKLTYSTSYDGIICSDTSLCIRLTEDSEEVASSVEAFWNSLEENQFAPTEQDVAFDKLKKDIDFGQSLAVVISTEHIKLNIECYDNRVAYTFYSKAQAILRAGFIKLAKFELQELLTKLPDPETNLISSTRINSYISQIEAYLNG